MSKYTNASELGRLAGRAKERNGKPLEREGIRQMLAAGRIKGVRAWVGDHPVWRIRTTEADRWLAERGVFDVEWVKQEGVSGRVEDIWVGA